jgi:predicted nucleotidyltransferase
MSKIPKDPEEVLQGVVDDYREVFGEDLVAAILYGSAATGEYIAGKSDINFMIVLSDKGIDGLDRTFDIVKKWKKRNVATPLFVTEGYIHSSLDVFPLEYLNFQKSHELVYGKEVLKGLTFDSRFLRLQCEREIKGKLLLLRESFVETGGKAKHLQQLIGQSIQALLAVFNGLLHLKGIALPPDKREVVQKVCTTFNMDRTLFDKLLDIREERVKPSAPQMAGLFQAYLEQIGTMWKVVDRLEAGEESPL